ncbi:ETX/MTX2 family pore-forming toxin [Kitasatospora purpeofusca]|uniref:ETX/MTX2 family pore-forming toxin n=1 Tax=Kitasatospora purpeofusca TaxID=67352 RepID=UPI00382E3105
MTDYLARIVSDYCNETWTDQAIIKERIDTFLKGAQVRIIGNATLSPPVITPTTDSQKIYSQVYTNNTSIEQSQTLKFSKTITRTVTTTKSKTFEVSEEVSFEVGLEGLGKMGGKIGVKASKTSTESQSDSVSELWAVDNPIKVPAKTTVECVVFVEEGAMSVDFECQGSIYMQGTDMMTGQTITMEYGEFLRFLLDRHPEKKAYYGADLGDASAKDSPRYRTSGNKLVGHCRGTLSAKAGVNVKTIINQVDPVPVAVVGYSHLDILSASEQAFKELATTVRLAP